MGLCAGGSQKPPAQILGQAKSLCKLETMLVLKQERYVLELAYEDLASRVIDQQMNLESFRLFFQKNGLWGQKLFKEFDYGQSNLITLEQFMRGIARIFKTSQKEKIGLLFSFFSQKCSMTDQGITFEDFLSMLYNYPKQDLKDIMNDQDFFNQQLKKHLVSTQENRRLDSIYYGEKGVGEKMVCNIDESQSSEKLPSTFGKNILKNLKNYQDMSTCVEFKYGQSKVQVRTTNIHHLVKKFAKNVFKAYKINVQTGKLNYRQFQEWILDHRNFYNNYYKGFHNQIWEFNQQTYKSKFLQTPADKISTAKFRIGDKLRRVRLFHFQQILVVCDGQAGEKPLCIICLQGLAVKKKIFEQETGFGIQISHRDGIYPNKQFFFKNQEICKEWLEQLKCHKGESVEALYQFKDKIGTGKFSIVYKAIEKEISAQWAIKVIETFKLDQQAKQLIAHESSIMSVLNNPFLIGYKTTIQTKAKTYIITELIEGKDLFQYVKENNCLSERKVAIIVYQIILGTKYLHSLGIIHRDLKPENIMVSFRGRQVTGMVKIIDFGFSNYLSSLRQLAPQDLLAGTPNYIAPQILRVQPIDEKIDNFAIGAIIYFSLSGNLPFNGINISEIFQKTLNGAFSFNDTVWSEISTDAKNLITGLLENNPTKRMSLEDALHHPWLKNAVSHTDNDRNKQLTKSKQFSKKQLQVF